MKNNEAAFPRPHSEDRFNEEIHFAQRGLTKRELFAAIAMQGLMNATFTYSREWSAKMTPNWIAQQSVKQADALIEELAK